MEVNIQQEIEARIAQLPEVVRDAIFQSDLNERIRAIGTSHKLHIDQMDQLEDEIMLVMLGLTKPEEFESHLVAQVKVDQMEAKALTQEINTTIFLPIRQLMQTQQSAAPAPATPAQPPASAPSTPVQPPAPVPHPAEVMLSQKTISVAPPTPVVPAAPKVAPPPPPAPSLTTTPATPDPAAPQPYKADPYREPIQ